MTTLEHAMVGANLVLASGLNRRFGWQLVAVAGVCAVLPDWDALTILWSVPLFDAAHRTWGHALLLCFTITAMFALLDYRLDLMTRLARCFSRRNNWNVVRSFRFVEPLFGFSLGLLPLALTFWPTWLFQERQRFPIGMSNCSGHFRIKGSCTRLFLGAMPETCSS